MDTRLFKNDKLYCEGQHKPVYRGYIHLYSLVLFPIGLWILYTGIASSYVFTIASLNLIGNYICFGTSAIFHIGNWSVQTEIILQKIDHIGISLWCFGMIAPFSLLLFPYHISNKIICLCSVAFLGNSFLIYISKPSIILSANIPMVFLLYIDSCTMHINQLELFFISCAYVFIAIGGFFYAFKITPSFFNTDIFGYHEIFHTFSVIVSIFTFLFTYSIAARYEDTINYNMLQ